MTELISCILLFAICWYLYQSKVSQPQAYDRDPNALRGWKPRRGI
jgi:hypothetical protein